MVCTFYENLSEILQRGLDRGRWRGTIQASPGRGHRAARTGRGDTTMRDRLYEVTGTIMGKRVKERVQTLDEARSIVSDLDTGNIWYLSALGRRRVATRRQVIRDSSTEVH